MTSILIEPHLYGRVLKTKTSYFTRVDGQYIPLGSDLTKARRQLQDILGTHDDDTIRAMCRSYIKEQRELFTRGDRNALAQATIDDYETGLEKNVLPVFGDMRPSEFRPAMVAQYLHRANKPTEAAPKGRAVRANREMAALGSAFNHGMVLGLVEANPCRGVKRNKERPRTRAVTVKEFNAFLAHAKAKGGSAYLVALIGAFVAISGRRRAEILFLPSSAITTDGIRCQSAKNKAGEAPRSYLIEWSDLLRTLLAEIRAVPRRVSSLLLFANNDGQPYTDAGFKCLWNRVMTSYAKSGGEWFRAHDLRAMYVSQMLQQGKNPNTHQNEETMRRVYDRRKTVNITPIG